MRTLFFALFASSLAWAAASDKLVSQVGAKDGVQYNQGSYSHDQCSPEARQLNSTGIAISQTDLPGALAAFTKSIKLCAGNPTAYSNRGVAFSLQGRHDEAIADMEKAIALLGDDPESAKLQSQALANEYVALGRVRTDNGKDFLAEDSFRKALKYDRNSAAAHSELAYLAAGRRSYPECIREANSGILANRKHSDSYANRGACLFALGKNKDALTDLNSAITFGPTPNLYVQRAGIQAALGDCEAAKKDAAQAVRELASLSKLAAEMLSPCK
jgi:tetratricopeptide (TPR) repeat protein